MTNKKYEINNLEQICNIVNDGNIENLLMDFAQYLIFYNNVIKSQREKYPEKTKNLSNIEIAKSNFIWTDDGLNELTGAIIKNASTGEVVEIKTPKKENETVLDPINIAQEIFNKMYLTSDPMGNYPMCFDTAKKCTEIAVDEIIQASPSLPILSDNGSYGSDIEENKEFWLEVKNSIDKIKPYNIK